MKILKTITAKISEKHVRMAIMVLTIALFVISAAAPNATVGIGK